METLSSQYFLPTNLLHITQHLILVGKVKDHSIGMSLVKDTLPQTRLSFPGKVSMDKSGERLFVADTGHHRILVISKEGIILNAIGGGENFEAGFVDGSFQEARFHSPQGIAIEQEIIYIADTENHAIRQVSDNFQRTTFCFHLIFSSHIMFWILSLIYDSGMQFLTQSCNCL